MTDSRSSTFEEADVWPLDSFQDNVNFLLDSKIDQMLHGLNERRKERLLERFVNFLNKKVEKHVKQALSLHKEVKNLQLFFHPDKNSSRSEEVKFIALEVSKQLNTLEKFAKNFAEDTQMQEDMREEINVPGTYVISLKYLPHVPRDENGAITIRGLTPLHGIGDLKRRFVDMLAKSGFPNLFDESAFVLDIYYYDDKNEFMKLSPFILLKDYPGKLLFAICKALSQEAGKRKAERLDCPAV